MIITTNKVSFPKNICLYSLNPLLGARQMLVRLNNKYYTCLSQHLAEEMDPRKA
jgi:hypothetical protein